VDGSAFAAHKANTALCRAFHLLQRKSIRCHPGICSLQTQDTSQLAKAMKRKWSTCSCRLVTTPLPSGSSLHFSVSHHTQYPQSPTPIPFQAKTSTFDLIPTARPVFAFPSFLVLRSNRPRFSKSQHIHYFLSPIPTSSSTASTPKLHPKQQPERIPFQPVNPSDLIPDPQNSPDRRSDPHQLSSTQTPQTAQRIPAQLPDCSASAHPGSASSMCLSPPAGAPRARFDGFR